MKILVSVFNNLYTDQRVEKVCETLSKNGYEIQLVGNTWDGAPAMERSYNFSRIPLHAKKLRLAYVEFQYKLYHFLAKNATDKTILLSNDLDTLLPNYLISRRLKIPLVFDSHEIFTEMPALQGRFTQKIWRYLEKKLVPKTRYMMTESESYAEWFREKYAVQPIVVRNIPRRISEAITISENNPKIILYQGVINQSRGLPQAILAMKNIENAIFFIIGDGPKKKEFENFAKENNLDRRVKFLGKMSPVEMRKVTITADVGLSLEENGGVSYLYSLPNKVSDYIQAKVPLVMINFPEMKRIKSQFNVGEMVENHQPEMIADKIKLVLSRGRSYYESELQKAGEVLCWENEEIKIKNLFNKVSIENFGS